MPNCGIKCNILHLCNIAIEIETNRTKRAKDVFRKGQYLVSYIMFLHTGTVMHYAAHVAILPAWSRRASQGLAFARFIVVDHVQESLSNKSCPAAVLAGRPALQSCPAVLPGSLARRQSCPTAVLPDGSLARRQSCPTAACPTAACPTVVLPDGILPDGSLARRQSFPEVQP
jgi:hypothetical protein